MRGGLACSIFPEVMAHRDGGVGVAGGEGKEGNARGGQGRDLVCKMLSKALL